MRAWDSSPPDWSPAHGSLELAAQDVGASDPLMSHSEVPTALRTAAAAWESSGRPRQGATEYTRSQWLDAFPEHAVLLHSLPDRLNRSDTRHLVQLHLQRDIVGAFLVSQIWGYGRRGYGPYRVRRILDQPAAANRLRRAYDALVARGPVAAFDAFADAQRLAGLGPAFFTKFLFFADPTQCALVLDEYVATWLQQYGDVRLTLYPARASAYSDYLAVIQRWALALDLEVDEVEQLIFAAEALTRPRNDWILEEPSG